MPIRPRFLAALVALCLACQSSANRRQGTVVVASGADLQSMNSLITTHPFAKQVQRYALLTTLVRFDSTLELLPYLARSWSWSSDSTSLTMKIFQGLKWHDGRPTTASDAAFTLNAALDSTIGYPRRTDLSPLVEAQAPDDSTLILRFSRPMLGIPDVLADLAILPKHYLDSVSRDQFRRASWNDRPIGNGPFRFVSHQLNRRWAFEANPEFPVALGGPPKLQRFVVAVVDEPMTKLAALTSGELDLAGIQPAHAEFVRRNPGLEVIEYPLLFSYALVFNTRREPFRQLKVRRALNQAVDRVAIVQGYLFGFGEPAVSLLPSALRGGDSLISGPYAPGRSRVLLGDAPLAFELVTVGHGEAALEQMIQQQLSQVGVKVTLRRIELATFLDRVERGRDFDAAVMGISGDLALGYLRSLLDIAGLAIPTSDEAVLSTVLDSIPAAMLYHARGVQGKSRRLIGVRMDLRGELPTLSEWQLR